MSIATEEQRTVAAGVDPPLPDTAGRMVVGPQFNRGFASQAQFEQYCVANGISLSGTDVTNVIPKTNG